MDIIGEDGKGEPQIQKKELWERKPEFKSDREVRILREDDTWELSTMSKVKAGNVFKIYAVSATGFTAGYENEYSIKEYEAISDAKLGDNGAWEIDCVTWEEEDDRPS